MRTRHESQVEDLRKELELALDAPDARPAKWTPQLVDMRRQQKRAVRERKFGEALDLLKSAEEREAEEVEWHRRKMKDGEFLFIWDSFRMGNSTDVVFLKQTTSRFSNRSSRDKQKNAPCSSASANAKRNELRRDAQKPRVG